MDIRIGFNNLIRNLNNKLTKKVFRTRIKLNRLSKRKKSQQKKIRRNIGLINRKALKNKRKNIRNKNSIKVRGLKLQEMLTRFI